MAKGKFIVFEGIDGCGKGTQLKLAHSYLWDFSKTVNVFSTREPTANFSEIRERMATGRVVSDDRIWYAQQFTADRINHRQNYLTPILALGIHVLCDRYYHSTLTYQNVQGISFEELLKMQKEYSEILIPDLTFIFDCPAEIAFERRKKAGITDVFERELEFQRKLRKDYLSLPGKLEEKIVVIDSIKSIEKVFKETKENIDILMDPKFKE